MRAEGGGDGPGKAPYTIDYEYCKGCLICVEVCPKKCIDEVRETESSGEQPPTIPTP